MALGEAPIWKDGVLHWVDCFATPRTGAIHRLSTHHSNDSEEEIIPVTKSALSTSKLENSVSVMYFRKGRGNDYICAYESGIGFIDVVNGVYGKLQVVKEIIPPSERELRRFNDGGVDAKGRFWFGEIDKKAARYGSLGKFYVSLICIVWRKIRSLVNHSLKKGLKTNIQLYRQYSPRLGNNWSIMEI